MGIFKRANAPGWWRIALVGALTLSALVMSGCVLSKPAPKIAAAANDTPDPDPQPIPQPSPEAVLRNQNTKLELLLAEKQARIDQLDLQIVGLQRQLDQAIQEVVRTKAKLASVESRAEAASELAEAEIALKALRSRIDPGEVPEALQAHRLLVMGTREFQRSNYGGALFLTAQAKSQIRAVVTRLDAKGTVEPTGGETPFSLPLQLQLRTRSNVRSGPGLGFEIVATLDAGSALTGLSYRGDWVRVESSDGTPGWIHQELIVAR